MLKKTFGLRQTHLKNHSISWNRFSSKLPPSALATTRSFCGIGGSFGTLKQAIEALRKNEHRGTLGCGLHVSKPDFSKIIGPTYGSVSLNKAIGVLPKTGAPYTVPTDQKKYATSLIFLPQDKTAREAALKLLQETLAASGLQIKCVLTEKSVVNKGLLHPSIAKDSPYIAQLFVEALDGSDLKESELAACREKFHREDPTHSYLPSLSVDSINYTLVGPADLFGKGFFKHMMHKDSEGAKEFVANPLFDISYFLFHIRFPTCGAGGGVEAKDFVNSLWINAQPAEKLIHNGTITNTASLISLYERLGGRFLGQSDSHLANLILQALVDEGLQLEDALAAALRPTGKSTLTPFNEMTPLEQWGLLFMPHFNGPSFIARLSDDGKLVTGRGGQGLRPGREEIQTATGNISVCSQTGIIFNSEEAEVSQQAAPGEIRVVNLETREVHTHNPVAPDHLQANLTARLETLDVERQLPVRMKKEAFTAFRQALPGGTTYQSMQDKLVHHYAQHGKEFTDSMGRKLFPAPFQPNPWPNDFYTHMAAQVLLPAADSKREMNDAAMTTFVGETISIADAAKYRVPRGVILENGPVISTAELTALTESEKISSLKLKTTLTQRRADTPISAADMDRKVQEIIRSALEALAQNTVGSDTNINAIILDDLDLITPGTKSIPMTEIGARISKAINQAYGNGTLKGNPPSLIANTAELMEYSDLAALGSVGGFTAVCPWKVEQDLMHSLTPETLGSNAEAYFQKWENYRLVQIRGCSKVMSKMPCLNWSDYVGTHNLSPLAFSRDTFEALGFRGTNDFGGTLSLDDLHNRYLAPVSDSIEDSPVNYDHPAILADIHAAISKGEYDALRKALDTLAAKQCAGQLGILPIKSAVSKSAVVVGTGFSGLESAKQLIALGFKEITFIADDIKGGGRLDTEVAPWHYSIKTPLEFLRERLGHEALDGVNIRYLGGKRLQTEGEMPSRDTLELETVKKLGDVVVLATGAETPNVIFDKTGDALCTPARVFSTTANHASEEAIKLLEKLPPKSNVVTIGAGNVVLDVLETLLCTPEQLNEGIPLADAFYIARDGKIGSVEAVIRKDMYATRFGSDQLIRTLDRIEAAGVHIAISLQEDFPPNPYEGIADIELSEEERTAKANHTEIAEKIRFYTTERLAPPDAQVLTLKFGQSPKWDGLRAQEGHLRLSTEKVTLDRSADPLKPKSKLVGDCAHIDCNLVITCTGQKRQAIPGVEFGKAGKTSDDRVVSVGWAAENGEGTVGHSALTVIRAMGYVQDYISSHTPIVRDVSSALAEAKLDTVAFDEFVFGTLGALSRATPLPTQIKDFRILHPETKAKLAATFSAIKDQVFAYYETADAGLPGLDERDDLLSDQVILETLAKLNYTTMIPFPFIRHHVQNVPKHLHEEYIQMITVAYMRAQEAHGLAVLPHSMSKGLEVNLVDPGKVHTEVRSITLQLPGEDITLKLTDEHNDMNLRDYLIRYENERFLKPPGACSSGGTCGECLLRISPSSKASATMSDKDFSRGTYQAVLNKHAGDAEPMVIGGAPGNYVLSCDIPVGSLAAGIVLDFTVS